MRVNVVDLVGNVVKVGCTIAYPVRTKSLMKMQVAKVTSIKSEIQGQGHIGIVATLVGENNRPKRFRSFDRCVVIQ